MFSAALELFNAIPTCWASKHSSVGLILLQRRSSDTEGVQRRCIPKCAVKSISCNHYSVGAPTLQLRSIGVPQNVLFSCHVVEKQFGGISVFILFSAFFIIRSLLPLAYKKQTLPLVGWSKKYLSVNFCHFFTPTDAVTENPHVNIWSLRNITNPTGWDSVKMC